MTLAGLSEAERREVEAFLFLEARLADTSRYDEWEALVADDMHYWVPAGPATGDPAATLRVADQLTDMFVAADKRLRSEQMNGAATFLARRADEIRDRLTSLHVNIRDTADGSQWEIESQ